MSISGRVDITQGSLFYRVHGAENTDRPWIVLSNSLLTDHSVWDGQIHMLTEGFRVLAYDQRGHGQSSPTAGPLGFDELGADVLALMDHLDVELAAIMGVSMGVPTALRAFQLQPDRFTHLVLVNGQFRSAPAAPAFWDERIQIANDEGMAGLAKASADRWLTPDASDTLRTKLQDMIAATPLQAFIDCAQALKAFDFLTSLPDIARPVQLIAGAADTVLADAMRAHWQDFGNARFDLVEGAGHLPNFERAEAFNAIVKPFLASSD